MESVDMDILTMYFEQFTEKAEIKKHGKNKWILKVANQSGKFSQFISWTEPSKTCCCLTFTQVLQTKQDMK